jgi:hypothetical protein
MLSEKQGLNSLNGYDQQSFNIPLFGSQHVALSLLCFSQSQPPGYFQLKRRHPDSRH